MCMMPLNHFSFFTISFCPYSFPAWGIFSNELALHIRWPNIGVSASASVIPMNIHDWFPLRLTGSLIFFCPRDSQESFPTPEFKSNNSSVLSLPYSQILISDMITGKIIPLPLQTFIGKVMFLLFNMLSRFVIAFLAKTKFLLTPWLHSPSSVILEPKKIKFVTVSIVCPSTYHKVMGLDARILVFWLCFFLFFFFFFFFLLVGG